MTDSESQRPTSQRPTSLAREVAQGLKAEFRTSLRWALRGAGVGAVLLGAAGFWFFGPTGLALGAGVGAMAGGLAVWLFLLSV